MADIYGQLVKAQFEQGTADLSNVESLVYYNTTAHTVKWYDATAWRTAVDTASTQTLTGKTLSGNIAVTLVSGAATLTLPTTTGTLATLANAETFTNKTLTSPLFGTNADFTAAAEARFYNAGGTFYVGFKGGNAGANKIWTLPLVDGAINQVLSTDGSATLGWSTAVDFGAEIGNLALTTSVSANALTIALKTKALTDPSAANVVTIAFRNATLTTGDYSVVTATAATSLVISSGSTLGHTSTVANVIYIYAINNAGTIELGASSTLFDEGTVQSSTTEGGAGAATSLSVLYSTTARTSKAIRLIGKLTSTQTTAGTWAAAPTITNPNTVRDVPSASVRGTQTNTTAGTGFIGEIIKVTLPLASEIAAGTTGAGKNVTATITLTPGTWEFSGAVCYDPSATTTVTGVNASISLTTNTVSGTGTIGVPVAGEMRSFSAYPAGYIPANIITVPIPSYRATVAAGSACGPFYLVANASYSGGTGISIFGWMEARRVF